MRLFVAVLLVFLASVSSVLAQSDLAWISKTARVLRNGAALGPDDPIEVLRKATREEVVDHFLNDPRFGDTALDFNLYFLGSKKDELRKASVNEFGSYEYDRDIFWNSNAVTSAAAVLNGGNYLDLFKEEHPMYLPPLVEPAEDKRGGEENATEEEMKELRKLTWTERRKRLVDRFLEKLDKVYKTLEERAKTQTRDEFCSSYLQEISGLSSQALTYRIGLRGQIFNSALYWYPRFRYCRYGGTVEEQLARIRRGRQAVVDLIKVADQLDPKVYKVTKVSDLKSFDTEKLFEMHPRYNSFGVGFWIDNQNSSTNMNLKRAATFLSRYFCDDLTPIQFLEPEEHSKGRHGSDPACLACHYKLKPMAGFFRNFGRFGRAHYGKEIHFDDSATAVFDEYVKEWHSKSPDRKWEVGYIRSSSREKLNSYGQSFSDLFKIIHESDEPKACLVKRASEYFFGREIIVDSGYLEYLTTKFILDSKKNSARAFKNLVRSLVLSRTFSTRDPKPNECYDYAPGVNPKNRPPCRIAAVISKNCAACHKPSSMRGGLDLTNWIKLEDGSFSFPHLDSSGTQKPKRETFESILDRISTSDPKKQMPKRRHISSKHREQIFKWVEEELR